MKDLHEAINEYAFQLAVIERLDKIIDLLEQLASDDSEADWEDMAEM